MNIPETLFTYIKEEASRIHHGRLIIELNETSNKIDVITETRERFPNCPEKTVRASENRNG